MKVIDKNIYYFLFLISIFYFMQFLFIYVIAPKGKTPTGGDVWVLLIKDTTSFDTGLYVCEVNSDPPFKSFHPLKGK